jgi:NAD(P)-dependent dehydrogenase (short-subunit alcohol dehydrogenase family)
MPGRNLIVAGASGGIGAAVALRAGRLGYRVAVNYLESEAAAGKVVQDIRDAGRTAIPVKADVATQTGVLQLFQETETTLGPICGLVNNAGITGGFARLDETTWKKLERR